MGTSGGAGDEHEDDRDPDRARIGAVEQRRLGGAIVEVAAPVERLGDGVGRRERDEGGGEERRADEPEAEQRLGGVAGERTQGDDGVGGVVDVQPAGVQRRRAGDHDEQTDDPGQRGAGDDVHAFVAQVCRGEALVDDVRLLEGQAHGARVVPMVATTVRIPARVRGRLGTTRPRPAAAQSGWARRPETM